MAKAVYSLTQVLAKIAGTAGYAANATVTFAFTPPASGTSSLGTTSALNTEQQGSVRFAMSLWDGVSNLRFSENNAGSDANIKLMNVQNSSFAGVQTGNQVMLSSVYSYMQAPTLGNYGTMAIIHEIGHALGLNHPGNYNGGSPTYAANAKFAQDTQQYTVMSYFAASYSGANHGGYYASTPLLYDIAAIQKMYGADMTTRAGDTIYGFNSTAGSTAFDFTVNTHPIVCVWDGGGTDTVDASGFNNNQVIDLHAGSFSDLGGLTKNFSVAYNCAIENAIGGAGNDTLTGNELNNRLTGGAGNDILNGDKGEDTLIGGGGNDYYYVNSAGDVVTENANEGSDTVVSSISFTLADNFENLALTGRESISGTGNSLNNTLTGNDGNNTLNGGAGDDTMIGGKGNDIYIVDSVSDIVRESSGQGTDLVYSSATFTLGDNVENLTFSGASNVDGTGNALANTITGNTGNNVLRGGGGADTLTGGGGNDTLSGQAGNDSLRGGDGADTFIFDTTSIGGKDAIKDFSVAQGDILNVYDLLTSHPSSGIESYVKLTVTGANEALYIDRDGSGTSYGFIQYATIEHVSGLTARSLFDSGLLIA